MSPRAAGPQEERRPSLTRARVLDAAMALADRDGIDSLTMRRLADELGAGAMSLYYHVGSKDELLDAMVDVVYGEIDLPSGDGDWKAALRRVALSARAALSGHRWAIGLMESRTHPGPANLRHHDAVVGHLLAAGFSTLAAVCALSTLDSYVYGFVLQELTLPFDTPEALAEVGDDMLAQFPTEEYPHLARTIVDLTQARFQFADGFEVGLDLVLDGLGTLRATL